MADITEAIIVGCLLGALALMVGLDVALNGSKLTKRFWGVLVGAGAVLMLWVGVMLGRPRRLGDVDDTPPEPLRRPDAVPLPKMSEEGPRLDDKALVEHHKHVAEAAEKHDVEPKVVDNLADLAKRRRNR